MLNNMDKDRYYMRQAISLAQAAAINNEVPIAAILVQDDQIIAQAHNLCETLQDATAHAELLVIRQAAEKLKQARLTDLTLYVTIEPCSMCAGAIILSRIERVVYGALDSKAGGVHSLFNILTHPHLNHQVQVTGGVLELECAQLVQKFFQKRRQNIRWC